MKSLRYIKHRSYSRGPAEMVQGLHHNPLKSKVPVQPSHSLTAKLLHNFKIPINSKQTSREPFVVHSILLAVNLMYIFRILCDKIPHGWLAWSNELELYRLPHPTQSTFLPWEKPSEAAVASVREVVMKPSYWKKLSTHLAEENHQVVVTQDNMSCVKSICKATPI
jgi:proteasome activator subunit 4